jgi:hypothetical protein
LSSSSLRSDPIVENKKSTRNLLRRGKTQHSGKKTKMNSPLSKKLVQSSTQPRKSSPNAKDKRKPNDALAIVLDEPSMLKILDPYRVRHSTNTTFSERFMQST